MPELIVTLNLGPEKVAAYYRGEARAVVARASNGQTVQFPMAVLHKCISADGIRGRFRLVFDEQNKFVRIEPVADADPNPAPA
jgi:hypothetical protein